MSKWPTLKIAFREMRAAARITNELVSWRVIHEVFILNYSGPMERVADLGTQMNIGLFGRANNEINR